MTGIWSSELTESFSLDASAGNSGICDIRLMLGGLWATQLAVNLEQAHATAEKELQHVKHANARNDRKDGSIPETDIFQSLQKQTQIR